ncbi:hypothetical protein V2G26_017730 [Clonostachys chloroleuca]
MCGASRRSGCLSRAKVNLKSGAKCSGLRFVAWFEGFGPNYSDNPPVFLRVLEYYDGILIVTSNRVGIFDEAFKSRIQLSLHYSNLDHNQRFQIWNNFFDHLHENQDALEIESASSKKSRKGGYGINIQDLTTHLDMLASANLNGREIRNALSTARQLAIYRKQRLDYSHLEIVMKEAQKFDKYPKEVHHGISEDDIKRGRKER